MLFSAAKSCYAERKKNIGGGCMFSVERFDQIVEMLKGEQVISVHNFARRLYVSEATVRRDLAELEKQGFVRRVYGGATLMKGNKDVPVFPAGKRSLGG